MSDYSQGKIYILKSKNTDDVYIGSTKYTLEERFHTHMMNYYQNKRGFKIYCSSYEVIKNGEPYIELLENYPCNNRQELRKKEGEYQSMMDCVNKRLAGRTDKEAKIEWLKNNKEHRQKYLKEYMSRPEVKKHRKEYEKDYYQNNKEKKKAYRKEYLKTRKDNKIKCICGSEIRKDNMRRHEKGKNHIQYIEEMKEKSDSTNLNEFFEQFKFKLTTN